MNFNKPGIFLPIALFALSMTAALRATGAPAAETGADQPTPSLLEEVIVTARKREEREQDVPVAMRTFTPKEIQRYSTQNLEDVAALTPQLVIGSSSNPNGGTINLRGVGASDGSAAVDQAVSLNIDGVQINHSNLIRLGQYDLAQISVLEGPQTLFFGKDSPAGVIAFKSADPTEEYEAKLRAGYEFYDQERFVEATVSGPITDWLKVRADIYGSKQLGWFENVAGNDPPNYYAQSNNTFPNQTEAFGRLTVIFSPSEKFDSNLKFSSNRVETQSGPSSDAQLFACPFGTPQTAYGFPDPDDCKVSRTYNIGKIAPDAAALNPLFRDGQPAYTSHIYLASNTANYRPTKELTFTSVTGYYEDHDFFLENQCFSQLSCLPAAADQTLSQFSQELRAVSSFNFPLNFAAGFFYGHNGFSLHDAVVFGPPIAPQYALFEDYIGRERSNTYSGFGQAIWKFAAQWEFAAGARYTTETIDQEATRSASVLNGFGPEVAIPKAKPQVKYNNVSPDVTLTYKPTQDLTLYAAYKQGFLAGGFNLFSFQSAGTDNSFGPETARGGEIGAKGVLLDRQLQFTANAYYYKYKDIQLNTFDPKILQNQVVNAGVAKVYGLESTLNFAPNPLPGFSIRGSVAYNRARYTEFFSDCYPGQTAAGGCNLGLANGTFNQQNLAGAPLVRAPDWGASLGAAFDHALTDNLALTASVDANYSASYFGQPEEDPRAVERSFTKINALLSIHRANRAWDVSLIGKNLTNKLTLANMSAVPFTGGGSGGPNPVLADLFGAVSPPRQIILQVTLTEAIFKH